MADDDEAMYALYRYRGTKRDEPPLYIGRTNSLMRRAEEHWSRRLGLLRLRGSILNGSRRLISPQLSVRRSSASHPVYDIQHNREGLHVEVAAEITYRPASQEEVALKLAAIVAVGMGAVLLLDMLANWSVSCRGWRAGEEIDLPPARNLFTSVVPAEQEPRPDPRQADDSELIGRNWTAKRNAVHLPIF
jgi:hypothetical protein